MEAPVLDDLLRPGLRAVFCGTAAGSLSAARGEYYAGRGNRFWTILHETGMTGGPRALPAGEWRRLDEHGLGLTDLWKAHSGADSSLPAGGFDSARLRSSILANSPQALAFNGLKAAKAFLGRPADYGLQPETVGETAVWVLPSTSGAANGRWDARHWHALAASLKAGIAPEELPRPL